MTPVDDDRNGGGAGGGLKEAMATVGTGDTHMLSERVYRSILRLVSRGQLRRGAPLRIEEISRILNVSPTPVREGLVRLAATGLVVHEPRKGFRVAPPLIGEQFERLMDARELLEVGAAGLALGSGGPAFVTALRGALDAQEAAVQAFRHLAPGTPAEEADDAEWAVIDADLSFHHVLFEFTNNPFVRIMADSLNGQSHRLRQSADRGVSDDLEAVTEHAAIVRAAESGDRGAIESAMRMHLRLVRARARNDIGTH
jgi:DNA-binding GntR family transcriptional regulator